MCNVLPVYRLGVLQAVTGGTAVSRGISDVLERATGARKKKNIATDVVSVKASTGDGLSNGKH